jgi:hypothetical protein
MSLEDWEPTDDGWRLMLRCAECEVWRAEQVSEEDAQAVDDQLAAETSELARVLARLEGERMEREARVLAIALERDLIDAGDFAR